MLHPLHTAPGDWENAKANLDLKVKVHTGPTKKRPDRLWEHNIMSPRYEIYSHSERKSMSDAGAKPRWSAILPRPVRCGDTGSSEAISWTRAQLNQCTSTHSDCNLDEPGRALPTRVLDLGEQEAITSDVRLYVTDKEQADYLCLSHCWGADSGLKPLRTVHERLEEFQIGISFGSLPKTFKDAVIFTRKLGYRYLWIDSLCIIQDDGDDWMREAGQMASIYENAVLTLSAASSSDSSGGLFRVTAHPEIPLGGSEKGQGQLAMRRFANPSFLAYAKRGSARDMTDAARTSPLFRRAWVFQERILSRRILFFTPLELVFECRDSNSTESGWSWIDSSPKHAFTSVYDRAISPTSLSALWRKLVGKFTQLRLSLEKDTLPAMAGVAQRFLLQAQSTDPNSYFAGLWRETFIEDLLWEVSSYRHDGHQRINPGIPSWSWARSDSPKRYAQRMILTHLSRLKDAVCVSKGPAANAPTSVESGYAVLSGYPIQAKMTRAGIVVDQNPRVCHIPDSDYPWYEDGPDKIENGDQLSILPLATSADAEHGTSIHAIVLRPNRNGDGSFTRIGVFRISIHHLRNHRYIFEGTSVFLDVCKRQVSYGESLLGDDGKYREVEGSSEPLYLAPKAGKELSAFKSQAHDLHLFLYGNKPELKSAEFIGQKHLDTLKSEMETEERRMEEWNRRNEQGEAQLYERVLVKIV